MTLRLVWLLGLLYSLAQPRFEFNNDLKKDKIILQSHGVHLDPEGYKYLKYVNYWARTDVSRWNYKFWRKNSYSIKQWSAPYNQRVKITVVETSVKIDTILNEADKLYPLKTAFNYRFYQITTPNNQFSYLTEKLEGLCYFEYGTKRFNVLREDIPLGFTGPDLNKIREAVQSGGIK